jgi:type IX secretion system PorP/SprF family membrane protein
MKKNTTIFHLICSIILNILMGITSSIYIALTDFFSVFRLIGARKSALKILCFSLFYAFGGSNKIQAQEQSFSNFYFYNPQIFNPAFAGAQGNRISATNQTHWYSVPGAPKFSTVMADGFFDKKVGWGAALTDDVQGIFKQNNFSAALSYKMQLSHNAALSIGFSGFFQHSNIRFNSIIVTNPDDPILRGGDFRGNIFNMGTGLAYQFNNLQIGISIPKVMAPTTVFNNGEGTINMLQNRQINGIGLYHINTGNERISLKPSIMFQYEKPENPFLLDAGLRVDYDGAGYVGLFIRNNSTIGLSLGIVARDKLSIAYAFSSYATQFKEYPGYNHEFLLGYKLSSRKKIEPKEKKEVDPTSKIKDVEELNRLLRLKEMEIVKMVDAFYSDENIDKESAKKEIEKIQQEIDAYRKQLNFYLERIKK